MEKRQYDSHFFQNTDCKYFPCHRDVPEEDFNCLFCYCPLYTLGRNCGGNCTYTENGVKSCKACSFPHRQENCDRIIARFPDIQEVVRRMDGENE